jgi:hypothetical protein
VRLVLDPNISQEEERTEQTTIWQIPSST